MQRLRLGASATPTIRELVTSSLFVRVEEQLAEAVDESEVALRVRKRGGPSWGQSEHRRIACPLRRAALCARAVNSFASRIEDSTEDSTASLV